MNLIDAYDGLAMLDQTYLNRSSHYRGEKKLPSMTKQERVMWHIKNLGLNQYQKNLIATETVSSNDFKELVGIEILPTYFYELKSYFQECGYGVKGMQHL